MRTLILAILIALSLNGVSWPTGETQADGSQPKADTHAAQRYDPLPAIALLTPAQSVIETLDDSTSVPAPLDPDEAETPSAPGPPGRSPVWNPAIGANGGTGTALIAGYATYFQSPGHTAAAGPLIRAALGDWRGKLLRVRSGERTTVVRLTDLCRCGDRAGLPTLLDLSPAAFQDLAPLSAGVVAVEIELVALTEQLPATDAQ